MQRLNIGLIGSGFMGRCHVHALRNAAPTFDLPLAPSLELLADVDAATAAKAAKALGFRRSTGDWRELVVDPAVDLVEITTPNVFHKPIALAAIAAGKPVYCEKPLAPNAADAKEMADAAEAAGVKTQVGFNYLKNPLVVLAREIVASGEIGEVIRFRGIHDEDYMSDPLTPWSWRLDPAGGHGAVADIGSHITSIARPVVGPIEAVCGQVRTIIPRRPAAPGSRETRPVEVDDQAQAIVRFANGADGTIEASWVAAGRKLTLTFEVTGTKGTVFLDFERMNELQLFTRDQPRGRTGFKTILTGPEHPFYASICPAAGHHIGFNDMKTIEVRGLIVGLAGGPPPSPDFREAWEIQRVVDAIVRSSREGRWVKISEI